MAELKVKLTAETIQAQNELKKFQQQLARTTDVRTIARLQSTIAKLEGSISSLSGSAAKAGRAFQGTNTTLINFNRVVQDSPFGIIAIANNIDPLVESFGRLRKETGSVGGALKAMGAGLLGPAGIAIAVSAATSLLIEFGPQIKNFIFGVDKAGEAAKESAKEQKEFNESLVEAESSARAAGAGLLGLIAVAKDANQSDSVRKNALKQLNEVTKEYGVTINSAALASGAAAAEVDKLTKAFIAQAVAEKLAGRIGDLLIKQGEASKQFAKDKEAQVKAQNALNTALKSEADTRSSLGGIGGAGDVTAKGLSQTNALNVATKTLAGTTKIYKDVTQELKDVYSLMTDQQAIALSITKIEKVEKEKLNKEDTERLRLLKEQAEQLRKSREENERIRKISDVALLANPNQRIQTDVAQAAPDLNADDVLKLGQLLTGPVFTEGKKMLDAMNESAKMLGSTLTSTFDAVFNSIANGENVFDGIIQNLQRLVVRLLAAAAAAAILQAVLPGSTLTTAFGGGKFMDIFKSLGGLKMAKGGTVFGPTPALIGEGGPEAVIPLSQLANIIGGIGGGGAVTVVGALRGNDIYITNNNARASVGRLFG